MMRRAMIVATTLALSAPAVGCSHVTSSVAGQNNVNGEAWYVETTSFGGLVFASTVYYCADASGGPARCKEAKMIDVGEGGAAVKSDFDMGDDQPKKKKKKPKKKKKVDVEEDDDDDDDDDEAKGDDDDDDEEEPKKKKKKKKKVDEDDDDDE